MGVITKTANLVMLLFILCSCEKMPDGYSRISYESFTNMDFASKIEKVIDKKYNNYICIKNSTMKGCFEVPLLITCPTSSDGYDVWRLENGKVLCNQFFRNGKNIYVIVPIDYQENEPMVSAGDSVFKDAGAKYFWWNGINFYVREIDTLKNLPAP